MTVWLERLARHHPGVTALVQGSTTLDYAALAGRASRHAAMLESLGVRAGDRVVLEAPVTLQSAVWLHALLWLGAAVVPVAPSRPPDANAVLFERLRPRAIIIANSSADSKSSRPPPGSDDCIIIDAEAAIEADVAPAAPAAPDPARVATVMLTSGSSSAPKAVPLTLGNHAASTAAIAERIGAGRADRWLLCLPLEHIGGLAILIRSVILGSAVVMMRRFDAREFMDQIHERRVTLTSLVPSMLDSVLQQGNEPPAASLRAALIGGASTNPSLLESARDCGWPVMPTWGMTEACSQLATPAPEHAAGMDFAAGPSPALPPLPGVEVRIGPSAALQVRGPMLFGGYLDEGTPGPDGCGWFTTGDQGIVEPDGAVRIIGRIDSIIISGGINVHLDAVTQRLLDCPLIRDAALVGIEDSRWGQRVAAAVVAGGPETGPQPVTEALAAWSRRHLSPAERPARWRIVDHIPRSSAGKPLTPALRALFE